MPWRAVAGPGDPYRVWLSEIMLQQTTVAAVVPYFNAFITRWPSVEALAAAKDEEVMAAWAGLGYYARARNLLKCAREVARRGAFPTSSAALSDLPGVGAYTSAAVAAIAFDEAVPVVDGNVERVIARLTMLEEPPKSAMDKVRASVTAMLIAERAGDFAQAMMDLGATICTPRKPACTACPVLTVCKSAKAGAQLEYPKKLPKRAKKNWSGAVFAPFAPDGRLLLRTRPPKGLLGGMPELFGTPWGDAPSNPFPAAPFGAQWQLAGNIRHVFTHADLTLDVYRTSVASARPVKNAYWRQPDEAGLPTVMKKAVDRART